MPKHHHIVLSVILFRQGTSGWVAQALEHDIAASGLDIEDAKRAFEQTVFGYLQVSTQEQLQPLGHLKPAPAVFWEAWDRVAKEEVAAQRMPSIPAYMMPVVTYDALPAR